MRENKALKTYNTLLKEFQNGEKTIILHEKSIQYDYTDNTAKIRGKALDREKSIYNSIRRSKTAIIDYSKANIWTYFITITFDKEKIDRYDYDIITQRLSNQLNNIRKRVAPNLKYIIVPEQHKDGAWHFHGLLADIDGLKLKKSGKKDLLHRPIYNIPNFNLGFTTATEVSDTQKVSGYITKYITKSLVENTFNKRRYWTSLNLDKPKTLKLLIPNEYMETYKSEMKKKSKFAKTYSYTDNESGEIIPLVSYIYQ